MICKFCNKEITYVNIVAECHYKGLFGSIHKDTIIDYDDNIDEVFSPDSYNCPECGEDITEFIKDSLNPIVKEDEDD